MRTSYKKGTDESQVPPVIREIVAVIKGSITETDSIHVRPTGLTSRPALIVFTYGNIVRVRTLLEHLRVLPELPFSYRTGEYRGDVSEDGRAGEPGYLHDVEKCKDPEALRILRALTEEELLKVVRDMTLSMMEKIKKIASE